MRTLFDTSKIFIEKQKDFLLQWRIKINNGLKDHYLAKGSVSSFKNELVNDREDTINICSLTSGNFTAIIKRKRVFLMRDVKFFICKHCGNIVGMIHDSGAPLSCCGENMTELVANTVDAAKEKHVPVITIEGDTVTVKVGSVAHPMLPEHYIQWIYLLTEQGGERKILKPGDAPEAVFVMTPGDKFIAAYEYCNLHGLWKA